MPPKKNTIKKKVPALPAPVATDNGTAPSPDKFSDAVGDVSKEPEKKMKESEEEVDKLLTKPSESKEFEKVSAVTKKVDVLVEDASDDEEATVTTKKPSVVSKAPPVNAPSVSPVTAPSAPSVTVPSAVSVTSPAGLSVTSPYLTMGDQRPAFPSPMRPGRPAKRQDMAVLCFGEIHDGNLGTYKFEKPDGSPAYAKDIHDCLISGPSEGNHLDIISVNWCKDDRTDDADVATVGKKGAKLRVVIGYVDGEKDFEDKLEKVARTFEKVTKPYNKKAPKIKAKCGGISNAGNPSNIEEVLFKRDVAYVITRIFPKEYFENDAQAEAILGKYFCFTPVDEAKELVMAAYAANE